MIPKFRAWHKDSKLMLDVLAIDFKNEQITADIETRKIYPDLDYWWKETDIPFSEIILEQSTGLLDKNGVEIYEGDMVKIDQRAPYDSHIPNDSVNEIVYKDSAFCVKEIRNVVDIEWPIIAGLYYIVDEEFEVIGNIYENPELLEAVK